MDIATLNHPVAENITKVIEEKGLKQRSVAERAGFSIQAFSDMLNGRKIIKISEVPIIAKALEITVNDLYKPLK